MKEEIKKRKEQN